MRTSGRASEKARELRHSAECSEGLMVNKPCSCEPVAWVPEKWCREDQARQIVEALRGLPAVHVDLFGRGAADFIEREFGGRDG